MDTADTFTLAFATALLATTAVRLWLDARQMRHVRRHRDSVPVNFAQVVGIDAHRKAADYTVARVRFASVNAVLAAAVLLGWTLLGGLDALNVAVRDAVQPRLGDMAYQLSLLGAVVLIGSLIELPATLYNTFVLEQRFGFNRLTFKLWLIDSLKGLAVGTVLGLPLAALVLWLMGATGANWWWWAWGTFMGFQLLMMVIYPTVIAPLFNRFAPLTDDTLRARVTALMARCGFRAQGLFVMDGSRRSAHGNAYFTGLGAAKRVVFFDTLLQRLTHGEVEAVLAHELGHFHHRHIVKRLILMAALSLCAFALLGWLAGRAWFFAGLGVTPNVTAPNDALALILFMFALPPFVFFVAPLLALLSRRDEYEADAYARSQANAVELKSALLKLYEDNAGTLTPDPWYVAFYASHPPAVQRLAALDTR